MARARPLGRIALSLSGGGYRAAAFHLGALDLLRRLELLEDVELLSTVSGGTLTGLAYALSVARGEPFTGFRKRLEAFVSKTNVVARALALATDPGRTRAGAPPSLIRAAAEVYAGPDCLGAARFGELLDAKTHLREIVVNATDMGSGLPFRFQRSRSRRVFIGNRRARIGREDSRDVRLADMLAASSCFPGAFEPMAFPDDFAWTRPLPQAQGEPSALPLPLMDGGIYDNQGLDGLLLAERRLLKRGLGIGLFLISDTTQRAVEILRLSRLTSQTGVSVRAALRGTQLLCGLSAALLVARLATALRAGRFSPAPDTLTLALPALAMTGLTFGLLLAEVRLRAFAMRHWRGIPVASLLRLGAGELLALLELRVRSLIALTSEVFMRRIRGLGYKRLYGDKNYESRRAACLIYALEDAAPGDGWLAPSPAQRALAGRAAAVPTTLWLEDERRLRDLVACGQSTACHSLLRHLVQRFGEDQQALPPEIAPLLARARELWERLRADPEALL